jgi:hypothetical protein
MFKTDSCRVAKIESLLHGKQKIHDIFLFRDRKDGKLK